MENHPDNIKFKCAFSKKGITTNIKICIAFIVFTALCICYVCSSAGGAWIGAAFILILILILALCVRSVYRLIEGSYLEITADGLLKCNYKGHRAVCYPIKEICSIEAVTLDQAGERHATFPVVLNTKGAELYPSDGVLITFNRAYLKSVFPVFFNPADIQGFISAIRQAMVTPNSSK